jgi:hypothetical protein
MTDDDPWVRRAGVAGICEPRLLVISRKVSRMLVVETHISEYDPHIPTRRTTAPARRSIRNVIEKEA